MTDYSELKKSAESCKGLKPMRLFDMEDKPVIYDDYGLLFDESRRRTSNYKIQNKDYGRFMLEATPEVVFALIAEVEALRADHSGGADKKEADDLYDRIISVLRDEREIRDPGRIAKLIIDEIERKKITEAQ